MIKGQKRLLLILGMLGDLFEDLADAGGLVSFSYEQVYGFVPRRYKKSNFEMAIRNALKVGDIKKVVRKGQAYVKLSLRGRNKLVQHFPLFKFQKTRWDRKWRIVFFDIEEENRRVRDLFRRKLYELGFGKLQKSVYISPLPIEEEMKEFIEALGLKEKVYLLVSPRLLAGDEKALVRKIWRLDEINREYERVLKRLRREKIGEKDKKEINSLYLEMLAVDPFLPTELLPKDWLGAKVGREIKKLKAKS